MKSQYSEISITILSLRPIIHPPPFPTSIDTMHSVFCDCIVLSDGRGGIVWKTAFQFAHHFETIPHKWLHEICHRL